MSRQLSSKVINTPTIMDGRLHIHRNRHGGRSLVLTCETGCLRLGSYANDREAGYAALHLIQLVAEYDDVPSQIDTLRQTMPPARQRQIEEKVEYLAEIQGVFGPSKQPVTQLSLSFRISPSTGYRGVSPHRSGRWRTTVKIKGRYRSLGYYQSPDEGAFAFNHLFHQLFDEDLSPNLIPDHNMPTPTRQAEIRTTVETKLSKYGILLTPTPDQIIRSC